MMILENQNLIGPSMNWDLEKEEISLGNLESMQWYLPIIEQ
jgi:hypothetical protein